MVRKKPGKRPNPLDAARALAEKQGKRIVPRDPERVAAFLRGDLTLGELEGITKGAQYQIAKVGYTFMQEGKYEDAQTVFSGLLALDPFDAYFLDVLGAIAQQEERLDEAEKYYSRSLEINPFGIHARANRGEVRILAGRIAEAAQDFRRALEDDPEGKDPASVRARAIVDAMQRQLDASAKDPEGAYQEAKKAFEDGGGVWEEDRVTRPEVSNAVATVDAPKEREPSAKKRQPSSAKAEREASSPKKRADSQAGHKKRSARRREPS